MKKYWNALKKNKIYDIRKTNPELARRKCEEYMSKYPRDYEAKILYANILITLGETSFAYEFLTKAILLYRTNKNLKADNKAYLDRRAYMTELRYLSFTKQYEQLYQLLDDYAYLNYDFVKQIKYYCEKKLGKDIAINKVKGYRNRQVVDYSYDKFRNRLEKHTVERNIGKKNPDPRIFSKDLPIDKILEEVKKSLPTAPRLYYGIMFTTYVFKYDHCGTENNEETDYLKVICTYDTNDIITMYPALECEELPYIDLNYLKDTNSENQKELSYVKKNQKTYM